MIFVEIDIVKFLQEHSSLFNWRDIPNPFFRNVVKEFDSHG